jgi:mRNA-degrading endonuclease toxin of MazEF toxin-antitoxin module
MGRIESGENPILSTESDYPSIIKTSQILTVAKERLEKRLGRFSEDRMDDVDRAIKLSLELS